MYGPHGTDPNQVVGAQKPPAEPADGWAINERSQPTGGGTLDSGSGKYAMFDGSAALFLQLPDGAQINTLIMYVATPQNVTIYSGAAVGGTGMFTTGGAAGTFRLPPGLKAITLVASAPFGVQNPVFISNEKLPPTVALQNVTATISGPVQVTPVATFPVNVTNTPSVKNTKLTDYPSGSTAWAQELNGQTMGTPPTIFSGSALVNQFLYVTSLRIQGLNAQDVHWSFVPGGDLLTATAMIGGKGDVDDVYGTPIPIAQWQNSGMGSISLVTGDTLLGTVTIYGYACGYIL